MTDHAVGRIDRLISRTTWQAQKPHPDGRGDDAIGKVLGETFDRRPADRRLIQLLRVAADDHRDSLAATLNSFTLQRSRNRLHMLLQTFLCRKRST